MSRRSWASSPRTRFAGMGSAPTRRACHMLSMPTHAAQPGNSRSIDAASACSRSMPFTVLLGVYSAEPVKKLAGTRSDDIALMAAVRRLVQGRPDGQAAGPLADLPHVAELLAECGAGHRERLHGNRTSAPVASGGVADALPGAISLPTSLARCSGLWTDRPGYAPDGLGTVPP